MNTEFLHRSKYFDSVDTELSWFFRTREFPIFYYGYDGKVSLRFYDWWSHFRNWGFEWCQKFRICHLWFSQYSEAANPGLLIFQHKSSDQLICFLEFFTLVLVFTSLSFFSFSISAFRKKTWIFLNWVFRLNFLIIKKLFTNNYFQVCEFWFKTNSNNFSNQNLFIKLIFSTQKCWFVLNMN